MKVTLLERKPGYWRLRIEGKDEFGRRKFSYESIRGDRSAAELRASQIRAGAAVRCAPAKDITFAAYIERWLGDRVAYGHISESTGETYQFLLKPMLNLLGHKTLSAVTKFDLDNAYRALVRKHDLYRIKNMSIQVRKAFDEAVDGGLLDTNPALGVKTPKAKRKVKETTFTPDQCTALIEQSKSWGLVGQIVRFAIATGCRRGEICGLQVRDFDFAKQTVQIRRGVTNLQGSVRVVDTKTASSRRVIALPEAICAELAERLKDAAPNDWAFPADFGGLRNPDYTSMQISRRFASCGIKNFSLHDLRHAHATLLLREKMPLKAVSQRLGHSDVRITLGIYTHVLVGDDENLASAINNIF